MTTLKPRKQLNSSQTEILEILYKFRFATLKLIAAYQELESEVYSYRRLRKLVADGYIGRHYDGNYKIHGKPAIYYLLPEGIQILKTNPELSTKALNAMYRDDLRAEPFMERCLDIFRLFIKLNELYADTLSFYSKYELTELGYFPKPLPDAYLTLETKQRGSRQYMLELIEATASRSTTKRRIEHYLKHFESEDWDVTGTEFPSLLLICENSSLERPIQRLAAKLLDIADLNELKIYITTAKAITGSGPENSVIWTDVTNPELLIGIG